MPDGGTIAFRVGEVALTLIGPGRLEGQEEALRALGPNDPWGSREPDFAMRAERAKVLYTVIAVGVVVVVTVIALAVVLM